MWSIFYIPFCSFMKPVVWRPPSMPAKLDVSCIMCTIFSTEEVFFFRGRTSTCHIYFPPVFSESGLWCQVPSFVLYFFHISTPKALISLNTSKLFSTSLWSMDSSIIEKFAFLALGTFFLVLFIKLHFNSRRQEGKVLFPTAFCVITW